MCDMVSAYYFRFNIAYTEDRIPVKRLHFYKVTPPVETAENTLLAYFKSFGNVLEFRLATDPNNMGEPCMGGGVKFSSFEDVEGALMSYKQRLTGKDPKDIMEPCLRGDVLYANAEDAARVLKCNRHCAEGKYFEVGPSYSWEQPDAYGTPTEQQSEPAPFLSLPDDCWVHILQYLDLRDKLRFARTCQRFKEVYKIASIESCKTIDSAQFMDMTLWDIRDFYQLTGDKVQNFTCSLFANQHLPFIASYCRNLFSLYLFVMELTKDDILKMPTSIVKLDLSSCMNITNIDIICQHLFKLKELSCNVSYVPETVWLDIIRKNYCPSLEVLRIRNRNDRDCHCQVLAQLPKLKMLTINSPQTEFLSGDPSKSLINQLVVHKADQLERFEVIGRLELPRNQLSLISKLSGLRTLILPFQQDITVGVLKEFADLKKMEEFSFYCKRLSHSDILNFFIACPRLSRIGLNELPTSEHELVPKIAERVRQECARKEMQRNLPIQLSINWDIQSIRDLIIDYRDVFRGIIRIIGDNSYYEYYDEITKYDESDEDSSMQYSSDDGWESEFTMSFCGF